MTIKMPIVREAFHHLLYQRLYIALFYTVGCLLLGTVGTYAYVRLGVSISLILWGGAAAVLPLNVVVYALAQAVKATLRSLAKSAMLWLIARSGNVLNVKRQRQIVRTALWACGAAIIIGTGVIAAALSSFVSFVSIRDSAPEHFAAMFAFTFLLELLVMLALAFVPVVVYRLFTRDAQQAQLGGYRERAHAMLIRVAEAQHYERINEELVSQVAVSGR